MKKRDRLFRFVTKGLSITDAAKKAGMSEGYARALMNEHKNLVGAEIGKKKKPPIIEIALSSPQVFFAQSLRDELQNELDGLAMKIGRKALAEAFTSRP